MWTHQYTERLKYYITELCYMEALSEKIYSENKQTLREKYYEVYLYTLI